MSARDLAIIAGDHAGVDRLNWMLSAACRGKDTSLWFPARGEWSGGNEAAQLCRSCIVRAECLTYGIENEPDQGIYGGVGVTERRRRSGRRIVATLREQAGMA